MIGGRGASVYIYRAERRRVLEEEQFKPLLLTGATFTKHFFIVRSPVLLHKLSLIICFLLFDYTEQTSFPYP